MFARLLAPAILTVALLLWLVGPAFAQAAGEAASSTTISLAPVFDYITGVVVAVLPPVLGVVLIYYARKWFGIKVDDMSRAVLTSGLEKGVSMAMNQARAQAKKVEDVNVHNELAATVAKYALARMPDAVARFKITADDLQKMALARIEERLNPPPAPAPAPVAPPAPPPQA